MSWKNPSQGAPTQEKTNGNTSKIFAKKVRNLRSWVVTWTGWVELVLFDTSYTTLWRKNNVTSKLFSDAIL